MFVFGLLKILQVIRAKSCALVDLWKVRTYSINIVNNLGNGAS